MGREYIAVALEGGRNIADSIIIQRSHPSREYRKHHSTILYIFQVRGNTKEQIDASGVAGLPVARNAGIVLPANGIGGCEGGSDLCVGMLWRIYRFSSHEPLIWEHPPCEGR